MWLIHPEFLFSSLVFCNLVLIVRLKYMVNLVAKESEDSRT